MKHLLFFLSILFGLFYLNSANAYYSCSEFGSMAYSTGDGYCKCMSGYIMSKNSLGSQYCISYDNYCTNKYGYGSKYSYSSDSCTCRYGYAFEKNIFGEVSCKMQSCGLYASFNDDIKQCECDDGYTRDTSYTMSFTCKKKAISAYFLLFSLNENRSKAIVYTNWNGGKYFSIDYGSGCYKISDYLDKIIVINLMYDQRLSYGDYLVLQNDNQTCKITNFKDITTTYNSLSTGINTTYSNSSNTKCGKNSTPTTDGKCSCNVGYIWEYPDIANNYDCKVKPTVCADTTNGYLGTDNKCYCNVGYSWNNASNSCKKNTSTVLKCKKGELKRNGKCISANSIK